MKKQPRKMSFRESNAHSETCKLLSFYLVPLQQLEKESMRINVKIAGKFNSLWVLFVVVFVLSSQQ